MSARANHSQSPKVSPLESNTTPAAKSSANLKSPQNLKNPQNLKALAKAFLRLADTPPDTPEELSHALQGLVDSGARFMAESSAESALDSAGLDSGILIVGLGNPGGKYARNRHNAGFMVLDRLAETLGARFESAPRFRAEIAQIATIPSLSAQSSTRSATSHCYLLKPQTFMNLSGESVGAFARFYKISKILVVHDELDIPFGALRYKCGGSSGGHNGLKSIDTHIRAYLGGTHYARLRFGIGDVSLRKPDDVAGFVLGDFAPESQSGLHALITHAMLGAAFFACTGDFAATQNFFTKAPTKTPAKTLAKAPESTTPESKALASTLDSAHADSPPASKPSRSADARDQVSDSAHAESSFRREADSTPASKTPAVFSTEAGDQIIKGK